LTNITKQGVALIGYNTTGPPWSVTDDDRRQRALLVWPTYTVMCRRASNNGHNLN